MVFFAGAGVTSTRLPSTLTSTRIPAFRPSALRTAIGKTICPLVEMRTALLMLSPGKSYLVGILDDRTSPARTSQTTELPQKPGQFTPWGPQVTRELCRTQLNCMPSVLRLPLIAGVVQRMSPHILMCPDFITHAVIGAPLTPAANADPTQRKPLKPRSPQSISINLPRRPNPHGSAPHPTPAL